MKTIQITKIAKDLNVTHGAVSQWFSGKTKPTITNVIKMNKLHAIPFDAWSDIKSFVTESATQSKNNTKV